MSQEAKQFIDHRRSTGQSDQQIYQELVGAGWDSIAAHQAVSGAGTSEPPVAKPRHTAADYFLFAGIGLIIAAAVVFITMSWPQLSPLTRFLTLAIPNTLLWLIASTLAGEPLRKVRHGLEATGLIMFPATVGVFLYQFGFVDQVDGPLMVWSGLAALIVYLFVALGSRRDYGWLLVGFASILTMSGFWSADQYGFGPFADGLSTLLLGCLNLLCIASFKRRGVTEYIGLAETIASILLIIGLPATIDEGLRGFGVAEDSIRLLVGLFGAWLLLFFAGMYGKLANLGPAESFQQRLIIIFALITMFGELLFFDGLFSGDKGQLMPAAVSIVAGLGLVYLGGLVKVRVLTIFASVGVIVSAIFLISQQIDTIAVPVLMSAVGFLAIVVSILLIKRGLGLEGLYQPAIAARLGAISDGTIIYRGHGQPPSPWLLLFLVLLVAVMFLFTANP